jgi:hypothetical protein
VEFPLPIRQRCRKERPKDGKTSEKKPQRRVQGEGRTAALKGDKTMSELAKQFDLHPNQIKQ